MLNQHVPQTIGNQLLFDNNNIELGSNVETIIKSLGKDINIITLCGSTKYKLWFEYITRILTLENYIVLQPGVFAHADGIEITDEQKINLDNLHKKKIDICDLVVFVNVENYIGTSTQSELDYSIKNKKIKLFLT